KWLDLGCGSGQLTRLLWQASKGRLSEVVGVDCAPADVIAYDKMRSRLVPPVRDNRVRFLAMDFSRGLSSWEDSHFGGVVPCLAIHYAESYCQTTGRWTSDGYDRLLREVRRVLRPGSPFVFSVNVPGTSSGRVALSAVRGVFKTGRPLRCLKKAW